MNCTEHTKQHSFEQEDRGLHGEGAQQCYCSHLPWQLLRLSSNFNYYPKGTVKLLETIAKCMTQCKFKAETWHFCSAVCHSLNFCKRFVMFYTKRDHDEAQALFE